MMQKPRIIAVTGPTACGKTGLAVALAKRFDGEIVSVDSRQVYRSMDLGTGKDLEEYGDVPYFLIDVASPEEIYDLSRFLADADAAVSGILSRGKLPILCGGTALYLDAFLRGYELEGAAPNPDLRRKLDALELDELRRMAEQSDPAGFAACTERNSRPRLRRLIENAILPTRKSAVGKYDTLTLGVYYPREVVRKRIEERLDARFSRGMADEVKRLIDAVGPERVACFGLEYREIGRFCAGECTFEEMRRNLLNRIRQFAKRQDIFFRKMERAGTVIHWLSAPEREEKAARLIADFLAGKTLPPPELKMTDIVYGRKSD